MICWKILLLQDNIYVHYIDCLWYEFSNGSTRDNLVYTAIILYKKNPHMPVFSSFPSRWWLWSVFIVLDTKETQLSGQSGCLAGSVYCSTKPISNFSISISIEDTTVCKKRLSLIYWYTKRARNTRSPCTCSSIQLFDYFHHLYIPKCNYTIRTTKI